MERKIIKNDSSSNELKLISKGKKGIAVVIALGFLTERKSKEKVGRYVRSIRKSGYKGNIFLYKWGSSGLFSWITKTILLFGTKRFLPAIPLTYFGQWKYTKSIAKKSGEELAGLLKNNKNIWSKKLILIGHSLGGYLIFNCLRKIKNNIVTNVYFLGAAISNDISWRRILNKVNNKIYNIYSEEDLVISILYNLGEFVSAIGAKGIKSRSSRIVNIDVSKRVNSHGEYYKVLNKFKY